MNVLSIVWDVDPVIFRLGFFEARWYGLLWGVGFVLCYEIAKRYLNRENCPKDWLDTLFIWCVVGTVLGARLGHCLFYQWDFYSAHPAEILKVWHGGLASHGGAIGVILAVWLFAATKAQKSVWWMFDRLMVCVAAICFCIRLGNLMNSEIFGFPTTLPWGFMFVRSDEWHQLYEGVACHPTQIYEMLYCLVAGITAWLMYRKGAQKHVGLITGICLLIFFVTRFALEFLKNPQVAREANMSFDIGQWLSMPFIALGVWLIVSSFKRYDKAAPWQLGKRK